MGNTLRVFLKTSHTDTQERRRKRIFHFRNLHRTSPRRDQEQQEEEEEQFTCEICAEPISNKFTNGETCFHPFCIDCVIKYIRVKIEDDNVGHIKCPAVNCNHVIDPLACAQVIGDLLFVRWCDVLCEATLLDQDKCYCPYPNCNALILDECGINHKESECPSCKGLFCFGCKKVWHAEFLDLTDPDDVSFANLAEQNAWRRCPRCMLFVAKHGGCKHVKCRCGISFCYDCGKQVHQNNCSCQMISFEDRIRELRDQEKRQSKERFAAKLGWHTIIAPWEREATASGK